MIGQSEKTQFTPDRGAVIVFILSNFLHSLPWRKFDRMHGASEGDWLTLTFVTLSLLRKLMSRKV